jgi:hypothetical protein
VSDRSAAAAASDRPAVTAVNADLFCMR